MKKRLAVRTAIVSAVVAPAMVFATGTATAVPTISAGAAGEVTVDVPEDETWNCFAFDSSFNVETGVFASGIGSLKGVEEGSTVTVLCIGNMSP